MADTFKPGEIIRTSGIYSVVLEGGDNEGRTFNATCVEATAFREHGRAPARTTS